MEDVIFVVFGGTGDLVKQKLAASFADLFSRGVISQGSEIVGVARGDLSDQSYKQILLESVKDEDKPMISNANVRFFKGDVSNPSSMSSLSQYISSMGKPGAKVVFYLAISFKLFMPIIKELKEQGLHENSIIIFEKPFGEDMVSANDLEISLSSAFKQEQIFRIDHYLGKERVGELASLPFNPSAMKSVSISANESGGVGERLGYYNHAGAVNDMVQSHLLQIVSLLHKSKIDFLRSLSFDRSKANILGQYSSYAEEAKSKGLAPARVETFARLHFSSSLPEWKHVDFVLQTGKRLGRKETRMTIDFMDSRESANIDLGKNAWDEHSALIEAALKGDKSMFPSPEEIMECWRIVEGISKQKLNFVIYADGINAGNIR